MDEFVKSLDPALDYLTHETHEHKIIITVESSLHEAICPYCSKKSSKVQLCLSERISRFTFTG